MTEVANSSRFTRPQAASPLCVIPPALSEAEGSGAARIFPPRRSLARRAAAVEGPGQRLRLNLDFNGRNKLAEHQCGKSSLRSRNFGSWNGSGRAFLAPPAFDLLFAADCRLGLAVRFVVHQARDVVLLREPVDEFLFVLADTALQEVW